MANPLRKIEAGDKTDTAGKEPEKSSPHDQQSNPEKESQ